MNKRHVFIAVGVFALLLVGLGAGLYLVGQRQLIIPRAATPNGTATVRLSLESKTAAATGEEFPVDILFTTGGNPVSAVSIELTYPFSGTEPPFTVPTIVPSTVLLQSGDWSFPIKSFAASGGVAKVRIAAINTSMAGFSADGETALATLTFRASGTPGTATVNFGAVQSKVTRKDTGADNLLIPTSSGTYVLQGSAAPTTAPTQVPEATATQVPDDGGDDGDGGATNTPTPRPTTVPRSSSGTSGGTTPQPAMPISGGIAPTGVLLVVGISLLLLGGASLLLF